MTEQTKELPVSKPEKPAGKAMPDGISSRFIERVGVTLEAHIGSAGMTVAEMRALVPGSAVTLDAPLNALVELRLNGIAVARGELVAVGEKFGVRVTEIAQWPD